jgi:hypothetical protein
MTLISTQTASNSGSLSWTGLSGYNSYMLVFHNIVPSINASQLLVNLGYGAGPTYITSGYSYAGVNTNTSAANAYVGGNGSANAGAFLLDIYAGITGSGGMGGVAFFEGMLSGNYTFFNFQSFTGEYTESGSGKNTNTSAKTAIKILMGSGTITSGSASLYGISS